MDYAKMKITIALCDDNALDRQALEHLLSDYLTEQGFQFELLTFSGGGELLSAIREKSFSLIFLDIYMKGVAGMEAARRIRSAGLTIPIVFTTNSRDFAVESYEVDALHYIVKPVTREKLTIAIKKCKQLLESSLRCLDIISDREVAQIYIKDILYAEAFGNKIVLHTNNGDISTYQSLDTFIKNVGEPFLRCHRSYLVNMDHVEKVCGKNFLLTGGIAVPIRTNGRSCVIQAYRRYFVLSD